MRPGRVPTVDGESIEPIRQPWHRRWPPRRRPSEIGLVSFLTILCWGLWIYLVLPLAGLVLWWLGARRVVAEVFTVGYTDLTQTLLSYTGIFLVMVSIFGLWVLWNVFLYGGTVRRDDKAPQVGSAEVRRAFDLGRYELAALRRTNVAHVDLDNGDHVCILARRRAATRPPPPGRRRVDSRAAAAPPVAPARRGRGPARRGRG